ncbi:MAG: hypothetical protein ACI841_001355 [Planctomycetota bacterium]|jgi:hypothetical protein
MKFKTLASTLALALLPASCANVPLGDGMPARSSMATARPGGSTWDANANGSDTVLYARDGSPVRSTSSESAITSGNGAPTPRIVSEGGGSRPYLLELYQQAVSEKDRLNLEVTSLNQDLSRQDESYRALEEELARFKLQFTQLETERDEIQKQNFELAGRLTTAQIRRLESEKMLLETIIEQRRSDGDGSVAGDAEPRGFLNPTNGTPASDSDRGGNR